MDETGVCYTEWSKPERKTRWSSKECWGEVNLDPERGEMGVFRQGP